MKTKTAMAAVASVIIESKCSEPFPLRRRTKIEMKRKEGDSSGGNDQKAESRRIETCYFSLTEP